MHIPRSAAGWARECDVARAERKPRLAEPQAVIEIGECVELHGPTTPFALDARTKIAGETCRLPDVSTDDFLIHVRDPLSVWRQKSLPGLQHPKGRITTANPGILGCSSSDGRAVGT